MSVLALFKWCENTAVGVALRNSQWMFPVVEAGHLIALAVLGAALLIVDLRLWGFGLRRRSVAEVAMSAEPLLVGSFVIMVITGSMLFATGATRYYYSAPFWFKVIALFLAVVFTWTVRRNVAMADPELVGPFWGRLVALVSMALWFGVSLASKAIGFY